jgi:hypothetical protein
LGSIGLKQGCAGHKNLHINGYPYSISHMGICQQDIPEAPLPSICRWRGRGINSSFRLSVPLLLRPHSVWQRCRALAWRPPLIGGQTHVPPSDHAV